MGGQIWFDGKFRAPSDGMIALSTHALHYGTCAFEGILCIRGRTGDELFRLGEHTDRLFASAAALQFCLPYSKEEINAAVVGLVQKNGSGSCYIRPLLFEDAGYLEFPGRHAKAHAAVLSKDINSQLLRFQMQKKLKLLVSDELRSCYAGELARAKLSGRYLHSVYALRRARAKGYDDVIFLDQDSNITEASAANVFVVTGGGVTTPESDKTIRGITQSSVLRIAGDLGHPTRVGPMSVDDLYAADEVFLTSTAKGIVSVSHINGREIVNKKRTSLAKELRSCYCAAICGQDAKYSQWLSRVPGGIRG